jgi:UDP-glucose 4-epimerase
VKILVTGAAGFIASHVADAYVAAGHEVIVLDDLSRGAKKNVNPKARFYQCDIRDREAVEEIFLGERPAIINHHAAQMDVRRGVREPIFDAQVNILGSLNLIEAAVAHGAKRFIYVSTAGAGYGEPKQMPVPENYPTNPITPYGISKHTVEHYLFTFQFLYGLPYVVLRYGNVYGPRQNSQGEAGVFAIFCEQMLAGVQPLIYGDGRKLRDYVYISDVVAANVAALERGSNEMFNIGSGVPTADLEVFQIVRQLLGKQVEPKYVARRPGEIDNICLDISKAKSILNWEPRVPLPEGARLVVSHFQKEMISAETSATQASVS